MKPPAERRQQGPREAGYNVKKKKKKKIASSFYEVHFIEGLARDPSLLDSDPPCSVRCERRVTPDHDRERASRARIPPFSKEERSFFQRLIFLLLSVDVYRVDTRRMYRQLLPPLYEHEP